MTLADELRPYVARIEQEAKQGNRLAQQVITLYQTHRACPGDHAAPVLCECAFNDWLRQRQEETEI